MTDTAARSLRVHPAEIIRRLADGEVIRFLDVRGQKALESTHLHIANSQRINAVLLDIKPEWDPTQLFVIYCT